jgi:hypothetical protein
MPYNRACPWLTHQMSDNSKATTNGKMVLDHSRCAEGFNGLALQQDRTSWKLVLSPDHQCKMTLPTAWREARNSIASATFSMRNRPPITGLSLPCS